MNGYLRLSTAETGESASRLAVRIARPEAPRTPTAQTAHGGQPRNIRIAGIGRRTSQPTRPLAPIPANRNQVRKYRQVDARRDYSAPSRHLLLCSSQTRRRLAFDLFGCDWMKALPGTSQGRAPFRAPLPQRLHSASPGGPRIQARESDERPVVGRTSGGIATPSLIRPVLVSAEGHAFVERCIACSLAGTRLGDEGAVCASPTLR